MPRGDGTGPMGMGPMTGRGAGYCAGYSAPGYANAAGGGYGCGIGRGRGRGFRRMYFSGGVPGAGRFPGYGYGYGYADPYLSADSEKDMLNRQAKFLEDQMAEIRKRLDDIENEAKK